GDDADAAGSFQHRVFDVAEVEQSLVLPGGGEDVFDADVLPAQSFLQGTAVFDEDQRGSFGESGHRSEAVLQPVGSSVGQHQGGDDQERVGDRVVVPQQCLLGGFTDDQQEDEVQGRGLGQGPLAGEA